MRKFIALKNDVFYSMEQKDKEIRFYAHKKKEPYEKRVDVTPDVLPSEDVLKDIVEKTHDDPQKSEEHKAFLAKLEERYEELQDPLARLEKRVARLEKIIDQIAGYYQVLGSDA